jgi:hypothetical protein
VGAAYSLGFGQAKRVSKPTSQLELGLSAKWGLGMCQAGLSICQAGLSICQAGLGAKRDGPFLGALSM